MTTWEINPEQATEIEELRRQLGISESVAATTKEHLYRRIERLKQKADTRPRYVYIAESVFVEDNPWDGRTRHGVCLTLEDALATMECFGSEDDPMVATPHAEKYAGFPVEEAWIVHRRTEKPNEEGALWIFKEKIRWNE